MTNEFNNKVILVTGGSSGVGLNLINFFLKQNAKIINVSRRKPPITNKKKKLRSVSFDLGDFKKYDNLLKKVSKIFGPIDYFVHAAGIHLIKPVRIINEKDIDKAINVNLKSPILISKYLLNNEIFKCPSSVVLISSVVGVVGSAGHSIYSASKAGLIGFTKSLSIELSRYKIRVNCISPGVIKSLLFANYSQQVTSEVNKKVIESHPLGIGTFDDINKTVKFLLSDDSKWITGHNLIIDGGYSVQ
jgi:NAD(P)-dependent dehydrogenase (short-subunit alcohol dehydrogenase family)